MPSDGSPERGGRRAAAAALFAFLLAVAAAGCGKGDGPPRRAALPAGAGASRDGGAAAEGRGAAPTPARGFGAFVTPSSPGRNAPASISVTSPPGKGSEILGVRWFVNGAERESGRRLEPARFERGDRIRAVVRLRAGEGETLLETPEVVAGNAIPEIDDVRIEPEAPITGSTVRAIVRGRDPDGDPLTFRYRWYVNDAAVPSEEGDSFPLKGVRKGSWVHVAVTPNDGATDGGLKYSADYQVVNAPPVVKSSAPTTIPPSRLLTHPIVAEDPDGDPITCSLVSGPEGCTLSGTTLKWQVADSDLGRTSTIVIRISDNDGASTVLTMILNPQKP